MEAVGTNDGGAAVNWNLARPYRRRKVMWDGARGRLPGRCTSGILDLLLLALVRVRPPHGPTSALMYDTDADDGRTADDYPLEASPSTGWRETVEIMEGDYGF